MARVPKRRPTSFRPEVSARRSAELARVLQDFVLQYAYRLPAEDVPLTRWIRALEGHGSGQGIRMPDGVDPTQTRSDELHARLLAELYPAILLAESAAILMREKAVIEGSFVTRELCGNDGSTLPGGFGTALLAARCLDAYSGKLRIAGTVAKTGTKKPDITWEPSGFRTIVFEQKDRCFGRALGDDSTRLARHAARKCFEASEQLPLDGSAITVGSWGAIAPYETAMAAADQFPEEVFAFGRRRHDAGERVPDAAVAIFLGLGVEIIGGTRHARVQAKTKVGQFTSVLTGYSCST